MKKMVNDYSDLKEFKLNDNSFCFNNFISTIDNNIKSLKDKISDLEEELSLSKQLIALANRELLDLPVSNKKEIAVLVSDKNFFVGEVERLNCDMNKQNKALKELISIKKQVECLLEIYKNNFNKINEIIKYHNANINTENINYSNNYLADVKMYKNNILSIIEKKKLLAKVVDTEMISVDILYNQLKDLEKIEQFYVSSNKNIELVEGHDNKESKVYISSDIDDFIFDINGDYEYIEKNNKSTSQLSLRKQIEMDGFIYDTEYSQKSKRKKIKTVKKSSNWRKIKKLLKKNIYKVLASLLVGVTMFFVPQISAGDGNYVNSKANISIVEESVATVDEVINNMDSKKEDVKEEYEQEKLIELNEIKDDNEVDLTIGDNVDVNSDIYINANDATKKENAMPSYYSSLDERSISAIAYSNGDKSDYITVTKDNKDKIKELEKLKYDVVAYCVSNDSQNIQYEGWHNIDDIKVKRY